MVARMTLRCISVVIAMLFLTLSSDAHALLIGTSVTGSIEFSFFPGTNFFDSSNGLVPSGCGNSAPNGTTVTIGAITEFCFENSSSSVGVDADFSDASLVLQEFSDASIFDTQTLTFTNSAFSGLILSEISDNIPNGMSCALAGTTVTCNFGGGNVHPGTYTASYSFSPAATVPEPASLSLLGFGVVALYCRRRRQS